MLAIGLMSGTSMDGVDAALIESDGESFNDTGHSFTISYPQELQDWIFATIKSPELQKLDVLDLEREITIKHAEAVLELLKQTGKKPKDIGVIGFHGQTILHAPHKHLTWQIGDGSLLAERTGISVVSDFRRRDVAAGGQGAPLVPIFNLALIKNEPKPVALLNIGGVANVAFHGEEENDILAFDTGPGNALINDWVYRKTGELFDKNGDLAMQGKADKILVGKMLEHEFFSKKPPKSLDRQSFNLRDFPDFQVADGAATLAEFTASAVAKGVVHFANRAKKWYVTGGGRKNRYIMNALAEKLEVPVEPIENLGANGDALEAQAFAYLAVRSINNLPLSMPSTTGVSRPVSGGAFYRA